jgi:serine protease AprX
VVKPDLIAPGNRIVSLRATQSDLDKYYRDLRVSAPGARKDEYFELSGTSMASAFVAGAAALMLEADPTLNPATIKARLMRSAEKLNGNPFDAGAGLLDIEAAINETGFVADAPSPRAFRHEDPAAVGVEDTAILWSDSTFGLANLWSDAILWSDAQLWSDANLWSDAILWSDGFLEGDAILWSDANLWSDAILWSDHEVWSDANLWSDAILWSDAVIWSDTELEGNSTLWGE